MAKYIDADLLKKEIAKHYDDYNGKFKSTGDCYYLGVADGLDVAERTIASLQKEQPEVNVEKVCGTCTYWQEGTLDRGMCQAGEPHQTHSAETCDMWKRHEEIPIEEQPSEDLVKAASSFAWEKEQPLADGERLSYTFKPRIEAFKAGAEWHKEQMLKEAKDGYVSAIIIHNNGDEEHYAVTYPNGERPHSITDKVKIIIVKEDKK